MATAAAKPIFWAARPADWIPLATSAACFLYILLRAWAIPVTHDEAATTILFTENDYAKLIRFDYGYISANNHLLNTLAAKFFSDWFGISPMSIRLGNVLASIGYLVAGFAIGKQLFGQNVALRAAAAAIWVGNPYLTEFFSLARGYGMSAALEACAIAAILSHRESLKNNPATAWRWLILANLTAALAVYANFTALNFYLFFTPAIVLGLVILRPSGWIFSVVISLITSALLAYFIKTPLQKIKAAGDFTYFGETSFWQDTVLSFGDCFVQGNGWMSLDWAFVFACFWALVAGFWWFCAYPNASGFGERTCPCFGCSYCYPVPLQSTCG